MTSLPEDLKDNPLLADSGLPRFDEIEPSHVVPAVRHLLATATKEFEALESAFAAGDLDPTRENLLDPMERLDVGFERTWGPVGHLIGVKNSPELREAHQTIQPEIVAFSVRASQSRPIYEALVRLRDGDAWGSLNDAQRRIVERNIREAEHSGVALEDDARKRFGEIATELSKLSTDFANHVLDSTKAFELVLTDPADVKDMPESFLGLAAQSYNAAHADEGTKATPEAGPWRVTLDFPSFLPYLKHGPNRAHREALYRAFVTRASEGDDDNSAIIERVLELRAEQAKMLGFANYAEVSLDRKMAPDVAAVQDMIDQLVTASKPHAEADLAELSALATEEGVTEDLALWDVAFWSEKLRQKRFDFSEEDLRPYFGLDRVLDGLFGLCERLFGVEIVRADGKAPIWHPDVRYFEVTDGGKPVASFYLDPYSRPEDKRGGAWMDVCRNRRRTGDDLQLPVAYLCCNGTPPVGDRPSLMTFGEAKTLFHEAGHGLQHMLTTIDDTGAAGINGIEWDAVEIASTFMENWCYHRPTVLGMTAHFETGEPLPEELFEKVAKARTFRAGSNMLRQMELTTIDVKLHAEYDPSGGGSAHDVSKAVGDEMSLIPRLPEDRFLCAFQHIFAGGYACGYYSYAWSAVLSADVFDAFVEAGLDDDAKVADVGRKYRDTLLALGGSRPPMDVFQSFRGREPKIDPLLRELGLDRPPATAAV